MKRNLAQRGFTLMEMVVVIIIMGIVATVALRSLTSTLETTKVEVTKQEMGQLVYACVGNPNLVASGMRTDFGYVGDIGTLPSGFDDLVTDPGYGTWNGPYIGNNFTESSTDFKTDAWGQAYTLNGVTIQSNGGGGGTLTKALAANSADLTSNTVSGYITDAAGNPPGDSASLLTVTLDYPDGSGGVTNATATVAASGAFDFSGTVPIGNHRVEAVYTSTNDTVMAYVSVLPGSTAYVTLRIPRAPWSVAPGGGGGGGGGTPSSGELIFVPGSAQCDGGTNQSPRFSIYNDGSSNIEVEWLIATYTQSPTAYFQQVRFGSPTVFSSNNPRAASGDTIYFSPPQTVQDGVTVIVRLQNFRDAQSGASNVVDMSDVDFSVEFSDGSVVNFNSGS
ncbi:MAG: carboxypeptidase-like regulatory domain-containing protein [bacterium]